MTEHATLATLTLSEMSGLIKNRSVSPVEVIDATLDRIDRLNGDYRLFISYYPELARASARQAEADIAAGNYRGPLHGIPLAAKDLFQVEGMERTCGSAFLKEPPSGKDATSVARLRQAGGVMTGLLNLNEFAYGPNGINIHHGNPRNAWNADYVCGGSSAASGAAIAAGVMPGTLGTDTGGSIRIPAALCGVVGMKQSFGLASRQGIYPLCHSFDHGGPLARTVRDVAILLQSIIGPDAHDATTYRAPELDLLSNIDKPVKGMRIGIPKTYYFDRLHEDVEAAILNVLPKLRDLGCEVVDVELPDMRLASNAWATISVAEAIQVHEENLQHHKDAYAPDVLERLLLGEGVTANDYLKAQRHRDVFCYQISEIMQDIDALITPTTVMPGAEVATGNYDGEAGFFDGAKLLGRFTRMACFTGQPAISLPCGLSREGLPIGVQFMGRNFADDRLLQLAQSVENCLDFKGRIPTDNQ